MYDYTLGQINALAAGHVAMDHERLAHTVSAVRLAVWGKDEDVQNFIDSDGGPVKVIDEVAEALAAFGFKEGTE